MNKFIVFLAVVFVIVLFSSCAGISNKEKVAYVKGCSLGMSKLISDAGYEPAADIIQDFCKKQAETQVTDISKLVQ